MGWEVWARIAQAMSCGTCHYAIRVNGKEACVWCEHRRSRERYLGATHGARYFWAGLALAGACAAGRKEAVDRHIEETHSLVAFANARGRSAWSVWYGIGAAAEERRLALQAMCDMRDSMLDDRAQECFDSAACIIESGDHAEAWDPNECGWRPREGS